MLGRRLRRGRWRRYLVERVADLKGAVDLQPVLHVLGIDDGAARQPRSGENLCVVDAKAMTLGDLDRLLVRR
jgi:hypothetical protein